MPNCMAGKETVKKLCHSPVSEEGAGACFGLVCFLFFRLFCGLPQLSILGLSILILAPFPNNQPGPDSIGIVAIAHGCVGVAARACGLVGLEPTKVIPLRQLHYVCY